MNKYQLIDKIYNWIDDKTVTNGEVKDTLKHLQEILVEEDERPVADWQSMYELAKEQHEEQLDKLNTEIEELRRTRDSYRQHYEERIEVLNNQLKRKSMEYRDLEKRYHDTKQLVLLQSRFMVYQDEKLDY